MVDQLKDYQNTVRDALTKVAADPDTMMRQSDVSKATAVVTKAFLPQIINATNQERWWQSNVTWGLIIAAVSQIAKPIAGELWSSDQAVELANSLTTLSTVFGLVWSWWGRWYAKNPLFFKNMFGK